MAPRRAAVQSLSVQLRCPDRLPALLPAHCFVPLSTPGDQDSRGDSRDGAPPPPPLARLAICCPSMFDIVDVAGVAGLTRLELSQCTFEPDHLETGPLRPPLACLARLREFEFADGTLAGDLSAAKRPWLPPSLTALALSNAGLRELPGVLRHLPRLRRCGPRCAARVAARAACVATC